MSSNAGALDKTDADCLGHVGTDHPKRWNGLGRFRHCARLSLNLRVRHGRKRPSRARICARDVRDPETAAKTWRTSDMAKPTFAQAAVPTETMRDAGNSRRGAHTQRRRKCGQTTQPCGADRRSTGAEEILSQARFRVSPLWPPRAFCGLFATSRRRYLNTVSAADPRKSPCRCCF